MYIDTEQNVVCIFTHQEIPRASLVGVEFVCVCDDPLEITFYRHAALMEQRAQLQVTGGGGGDSAADL